jgi:SAM-dependent methyltransferase
MQPSRWEKQVLYRLWKQLQDWVDESPSTRSLQLLFHILQTGGVRQLFQPYSDSFYDEYEPLRQGYAALASLLFDFFQPESVCDFGCGCGLLLSNLQAQGIEVCGVEGSHAAKPHISSELREWIRFADVTQFCEVGRFDLVLSTEVAEHIPKRHSVALIENLTRTAERRIFFSAAHPGQWGDGHINCQPQAYWIELFQQMDGFYDAIDSAKFTEMMINDPCIVEQLPWLLRNVMNFHHSGAECN